MSGVLNYDLTGGDVSELKNFYTALNFKYLRLNILKILLKSTFY